MPPYRTPGVYILDSSSSFPTSVVAVDTSIPAFVGYTELSGDGQTLRQNVPTRITSLVEFEAIFGGPPRPLFHVRPLDPPATGPISVDGKPWAVNPAAPLQQRFLLHPSLSLFFANGGGTCYVISVGTYAGGAITLDALNKGIDQLEKQPEPALLVVPDAVHLATRADCTALQQHMIQHCAVTMQSRFAILDLYEDDLYDGHQAASDPVQLFRDNLTSDHLDYAAAYYPWLNTSIVSDTGLSSDAIDPDDLAAVLTAEAAQPPAGPAVPPALIAQIKARTGDPATIAQTLRAASPIYRQILSEIARQSNILPPSGALAGVYAQVDQSRGVWIAPANVALNAVVSPTRTLTDADQDNLNADPSGKAVNAIRSFPAQGVLVWGARTLLANSPDWRYVNVRRTMLMIEQSIKLELRNFIFEANDIAAWTAINSTVGTFLNSLWKQGALAGGTSEEAYSVSCGLGLTMTPDDITNGYLKVTASVAIIHPAEFIVTTFEQLMQTS